MSEHERIWLEPAPGADEDYGRQWAQHNVWPDGVEYVRVDMAVWPQEIIDFLYKHGDLTYSAAARTVQLLTGNGFGFTASPERSASVWLENAKMRKALSKIADMIDDEDADLDDAISIATSALPTPTQD